MYQKIDIKRKYFEMNLQSFYKFRKIFLFIICLSVLSVILLISLSPENQKENVGNITNPISIIIAASLSVLDYTDKRLMARLEKGFSNVNLRISSMGFSRIFFTYSGIITLELQRNIMLSDLLWLIGYGPLIYYSLKMYVLFHNYSSKKRDL